jgi:NAD(P)-dependent dehydrogenase (short-subunit alcohol dehydrogenase family)
LAELGASVVVNDLGTSTAGEGSGAGPADDAVAEIEAAGGSAVSDGNDVSSVDGATAIVATALDRFGRLDVIVNNAGIVRWAAMPEVDTENLEATLAVHVGGSFQTTRAAWPHFVEQGYGRIVMTTSAGMFGLPDNTTYATAKAGIVGLTRSVARSGADHGIKVNAVAPAAATRMGGDTRAAEMAPELAAPMVAFLAHADCPVTGEVYAAGMGRFARIFLAQAPGYVHPEGIPTVDDVARHWGEINAEEGYTVPADLTAWSQDFTAHLRDPGSGR